MDPSTLPNEQDIFNRITEGDELREDESGVYSPSVRLSAQPWFGFIINFTCSPTNADKLVASVLDGVKQLRPDTKK